MVFVSEAETAFDIIIRLRYDDVRIISKYHYLLYRHKIKWKKFKIEWKGLKLLLKDMINSWCKNKDY